MSKEYMEKFGSGPITKEQMREYCSRPGRLDEHGKPLYTTEQSHKDTCNINKIIRKYDKTGLIRHVSTIEAKFGSLSGDDFKTMVDRVMEARRMFNELPANVRKRFENDPGKLLEFMEDGANRQEAIDLGLIDQQWSEGTDGIGEHAVRDEDGNLTELDGIPQP